MSSPHYFFNSRGGCGISLPSGAISNSGRIAGGTYYGVGIILRGYSTISNSGVIAGGAFGGVGIILEAGGTISNTGMIAGSAGGGPGRHGGYGIIVRGGAATIGNSGTIAGGRGSLGESFEAIDGGKGGIAVFLIGGIINNSALIAGGAGGSGRYKNGGDGGVGVMMTGIGAITNFGTITGGLGGNGGNYKYGHIAHFGGGGGTGISLSGGAIENAGMILGGRGGGGGRYKTGGDGGVGVILTGIGAITNSGTIMGGLGSNGGAGSGAAGAGVLLALGGVVFNKFHRSLIVGKIGIQALSTTNVTINNFGTIASIYGTSGTAVDMSGATGNKLFIRPGSAFVGKVLGGGKSEIDFKTTGTADMTGVSGFNTIRLVSGSAHALTLANFNFAAVSGPITVNDGNSGNTVNGSALAATHAIVVHAGSGADSLTGGAGADLFYSGGDTVMTGKAGKNEFIFSAPGSNTVADFAVSASNEIVVSNQGFHLGLSGAGSTPKPLPATLFVADSDGHFTNTTERFAYATGTSELFYSSSGSGGAAHLVTHLSGTPPPALGLSDLFYIA